MYRTRTSRLAIAVTAVFTGLSAGPMAGAAPLIQERSPMPPGCKAALDRLQSERANRSTPPSDASIIDKTNHVMFMTRDLLLTMAVSCQDWPDYERSRVELQATYDQSMAACRAVATDPTDCRPVGYGW